MDRAALYRAVIAKRRAFHLRGYVSYAQAGFDGAYVCPIHLTSGNLSGVVLMTKDWLDAPSAARHAKRLAVQGYLAEIPFNRVLDRALSLSGLRRADIYITPVFKLLPPQRSHAIPVRDIKASFEAVSRHEIMGRPVIAAGKAAITALQASGHIHIPTAHPSARGKDFETRARQLAAALSTAITRRAA